MIHPLIDNPVERYGASRGDVLIVKIDDAYELSTVTSASRLCDPLRHRVHGMDADEKFDVVEAYNVDNPSLQHLLPTSRMRFDTADLASTWVCNVLSPFDSSYEEVAR